MSAERRRPREVFRLAVVALTLLVAGIGALWAVLTPGFRAPDEPQHVDTVLHVVAGDGWAPPGEQVFLQGVHVAADEAGWVESGLELVQQNSHAHPGAWWGTGPTPFVLLSPEPADPADRTVILDVDHRVTLFQQVDQMTQHPPAYYGLAAGYLKVLGADGWAWDTQLLALRLLDVVLISGVVPLTVIAIRNLGGSRSAALVGAFGITAPAQLLYVNSAVTNDALLNLCGAGVLALSAVVLRGRWDWRHVVGTGLVLGAGLMTKGFMLAFIPVVALAFLLSTASGRPLRARALGAFWSLGVAFVVGGWWWLKNLFVHGTFQPDGYPGREPLDDVSHLGLSTPQFLLGAERNIVSSTWGNFGWLETPMPEWYQHVLTYVTLAIVVAGIVLAGRHRKALLVLVAAWVGVLGVVVYGAYQEYWSTGLLAGLQGRYLFVAVVGLLAAFAIAVDAAARRGSAMVATAVRVGVALICLVLAVHGLWYGFTAFYAESYEGLSAGLNRWNIWSSFGIPKLFALLGATAALAVASLVLLGVQSWRDSRLPAGASAAEPGADLGDGAPDDLARPGVPADPARGTEQTDRPAAGERGRDA
ncbi:MAG: DUF2142 domain-containing protein [Actinomycetaceae bacterium]